ncbi:MAG: uroporphyrinogen-III synthase [Anaerolineales bacterium]
MIKVLITRPLSQSAEFANRLAEAGFEAVLFPVIEIQSEEDKSALDKALNQLNQYDWVIFTSVNGVRLFFNRLLERKLSFPTKSSASLKVAAIGPKTASALLQRGVSVDWIPSEYVAEAILPGLGDLNGKWVLLPRAKIARPALPEAIQKAGGIVHEIALYQTKVVEVDQKSLAVFDQDIDWITFTSPSTVNHFVEILFNHQIDPLRLKGNPKIVCIGPITAQAAKSAGYSVEIIAQEYTTDGLVQALLNYYSLAK